MHFNKRIRKHFEVGMGNGKRVGVPDGKRVGVPFFLVISKKHLCVFLGLGFSSNYLLSGQEKIMKRFKGFVLLRSLDT